MVRQRDGRQVKVDKIKSGRYIWYISGTSGRYIWYVSGTYLVLTSGRYGCTKVVFMTKPV